MTDPIESVDRGPRQVARRAHIKADAHELFEILVNPHRHHEVDGSGTVKSEVIGPRELRTGDKFRVGMKLHGVPYAITSVATDVVPDRVVEWQHPGKHRWRWELEPQDDGTTQVTEVFDYRPSAMAPVLERLKVPATNAKGISESLQKLQQRFA
ncbi:MAG: SRPBCC family protein [Micrococcales bacterium]|nr:SRPBCC family protein [Micrococcales bacterium]